jgi:aminoglycoside phosphotransferase (APT) family kinase protein
MIDLAHLLPEAVLGTVHTVEPITIGQSGAAVYAVDSSRGSYVLRLAGDRPEAAFWSQQLLVQQRAAAVGVAPAIVHVDEPARAVVSRRVQGMPLVAALTDPEQRGPVLRSVVERLRRLHAVNQEGVVDRDPLGYARGLYEAQRGRPGYPGWAELGGLLAEVAAALVADPRRVVGHNDLNPTNVLWDGSAAWLVDWDVAGLAHPHYDLAVLTNFLRLADEPARGLLAAHDERPVDETTWARFGLLRRFAAAINGLIFLTLVPDLAGSSEPEAPTLDAFYAELRSGAVDLTSASGRRRFGLALLRLATDR